MNNLDIGATIRERRCFLKIDQKTLSELSGVAVHTISNVESGKGNPTIEVINKIINVLGMDLTVRVEHES
ncbi:helix-turn-helix domain-containing protein [Verrucomicrobiota bacterium]